MAAFKGKKIPQKQVEYLLLHGEWRLDHKISQLLHEKVYQNMSGEVLHEHFGGRGVIYDVENGRLFKQAMRKADTRRPAHILMGIFNYGHDFADIASSLAQHVVEKLYDRNLDYSMASLGALDKGLRRLAKGELCEEPLFGEIVAYVGEVLVRDFSGKWSMKPAEGGVMEPWVYLCDAPPVPVFAIVYREIFESHPNVSIQGALSGEMKKIPIARGARDQLRYFTDFTKRPDNNEE